MKEKAISIYHRVYKREDFNKAAKDLFELVKNAQIKFPNQLRYLYVDIMEHKNSEDGFDRDMFDLHKFVVDFLLQFCHEVHMPLFDIKNDNQKNDIPEKLKIIDIDKKDTGTIKEESLLIENYSNTEFVYENDVYNYLKKLSDFLKEYNDLDSYYSSNMKYTFDESRWLITWRMQMKELIIELVNAFVSGNFYTVSAMTRTLIEFYVYIKIILKEGKSELIDEWCICESIKTLKKNNNKELRTYFEKYMETKEIDFEEKWNFYTKKGENENSWLRSIIDKKGKITFFDVCKYLDEAYIYEDFSDACDFVHSLSLNSKLFPFTFYSSIYSKMFIMLNYVFKSIRLFELPDDLDKKIDNLLIELKKLSNKYLKY